MNRFLNKIRVLHIKRKYRIGNFKNARVASSYHFSFYDSKRTIGKNIIIDNNVKISCIRKTSNDAELIIGNYVYINSGVLINYSKKILIGDNCFIGPNVSIFDFNHGLKNRNELISEEVKIGNNVWIGASAIILAGVTIGDNVTVGAGSVVTKSFPDNVIICGNPAKIIKAAN